jgi:hypothetical protein
MSEMEQSDFFINAKFYASMWFRKNYLEFVLHFDINRA